ncbi:MAG: thioredoxin family protein [Patescibacteria group bacterium]|nr:thioredoxin family protein [Patescibacteria group bacterium]MDE1946128.1 thioredoxin family protein [Patescibacteria group bacterium]
MAINWKTYLYAFLITLAVFLVALYASDAVTNSRAAAVKASEDKASNDILASETEFALLGQVSCKDIDKSTLAGELGEIGDKLSFLEASADDTNPDVIAMKEYYSILEVKDFILTKQLDAKCQNAPVAILYFYANDCAACQAVGDGLTALHAKYPSLRIYSFDRNLDMPLIRTLAQLYNVGTSTPEVVVNEHLIPKIDTIADIENALPKWLRTGATSTAATTRR